MTVDTRGWVWLGVLAAMTAGAVAVAVAIPPLG